MSVVRAKWACAVAALMAGCASDEAAVGPGPSGSTNVTQGGAQDFELFRSLVEQGEVPSPSLLDPVGFFAEHAMDLPPADCGLSLCVQPMLAVAPRFDGISNWTMAFVAMNTPVDPAQLERPDVHMVIAIERGAWIEQFRSGLRAGLEHLVGELRPEDRLSVVSFGRTATHHVTAQPPAVDLVTPIADTLQSEDAISLYDALAAASRVIDQAAQERDLAHRIVVVGAGHADAGVTDPDRIVALGSALVKRGAALGLVGINQDYDARLPSALGSLGAGTFSFAGDAADLERVLEIEGQTTLFPLATELRLQVEPAPGYRVGRIYGAHRATVLGGAAHLDLPAVFIGQRDGAEDTAGGRRGGGGGLFVELVADSDSDMGRGQPAFHVSATWRAASGDEQTSDIDVVNPLAPGENPDDVWWFQSHQEGEKAFMMLNMFLALRATSVFFHEGDCARAVGVPEMMMTMTDAWQGKFDDPDIAADTSVLLNLGANARVRCEGHGPVVPVRPVQSDAGCCFL